MRYTTESSNWMAKMAKTAEARIFKGTTDGAFRYKLLHTHVGKKPALPVEYGGKTFSTKEDGKRNYARLVREFEDYEVLTGDAHTITAELMKRKYGKLPTGAKFFKLEETSLAIGVLEKGKKPVASCFASDLFSDSQKWSTGHTAEEIKHYHRTNFDTMLSYM